MAVPKRALDDADRLVSQALAKKLAAEKPPAEEANPYLDLELPDALPDGVNPDEAAALLAQLKASSGWERAKIKVRLVELGVFPDSTFIKEGPGRSKPEVPEAVARGFAPSLQLVGGPSPPAPKHGEAELVLIHALTIPGETRVKLMDAINPDEMQGPGAKKVARLIIDRLIEGKSIESVLLKDLLSRDGAAVDVGAAAIVDLALKTELPSEEALLELAKNIRLRKIEAEEIEARQELSRLALDGRLRNGSLQAKVGDLMAKLSDRRLEVEGDGADGAPVPWPAPAEEACLHGVAGEIIRTIEPFTVADPMAILLQFLAAFANMAGRNPCWYHEDTRHALNLFVAVIGPSATGAKGTGKDVALRVIDTCDSTWRHRTGLVSGEGLIHSVRDACDGAGGGVVDLGGDKRALYIETELSSLLSARNRQGNTLGEILRKAWDGDTLGIASRNNPSSAAGYHISLLAHMTFDELGRKFSSADKANGFGNRFLWACSRQSKIEPAPRKSPIDWEATGVRGKIRDALEFAGTDSDPLRHPRGLVLVRDEAAKKLWAKSVPRLNAPGSGLLGAMLARGKPQVMRLAGIYAVLDCSSHIRREHLEAALALWGFCVRSTKFIFGGGVDDLSGDQERALKLISATPMGLTLRALARLGFRCETQRAGEAIRGLLRAGLVRDCEEKTAGRPRTVFRAVLGVPE
jgi:Protein of unknown function (DUF3987)